MSAVRAPDNGRISRGRQLASFHPSFVTNDRLSSKLFQQDCSVMLIVMLIAAYNADPAAGRGGERDPGPGEAGRGQQRRPHPGLGQPLRQELRED